MLTFVTGAWKFFVGGGWKWVLAAGLISFALKFGYDAYNDYQALVARNIEQAETIGELNTANAANTATIQAMEEQARETAENLEFLSSQLLDAEDRVNDLEGLLSRHDLEFLALNRPGLIERRINDATDDVFSDLECLTDPNCVQPIPTE